MTELIYIVTPDDPDASPHPSVAHLPPYPARREDYEVWRLWANDHFEAGRVPVLRARIEELAPTARARLVVAWRAILGHWAQRRSVSPDDAPLIMHHFLANARHAPPFVMVAARELTRVCVRAGATSTDVLFLAAAWAWPLRDADAELGDLCWSYMIHAPWQTDTLSMRDLIEAVEANQGWGDGRGLVDLAQARLEAGQRASARRLLEGTALIQSKRQRLDQIRSYREFASAPIVEGANEAIVRLAELYVDEHENQVHAREVMKRAAELTRSHQLIDVIEDRIWDRPLDEAYRWTERLEHPRQLDEELALALEHGQPHHARRLAEAVMVRKFYRSWYGSAVENVPAALERFERGLERSPPSDPVARRAAEHLAVLYMRTHHVTQHARNFVHAVADSIAFTGRGAELHDLKGELEYFYNRSDPYHVLRHDASFLQQRATHLSDDERAASDEVERWFSDRFRPDNSRVIDRLARLIAQPLVDAARLAGELPYIEQTCRAAFEVMAERGSALAGDVDGISKQAAIIRSQYGHGMKLMAYAREVTARETFAAVTLAMSTSFLPPGLSLASHAMDLGASLLLAFRAVARVGAVFGRHMHGMDELQLVADSFTVGLSSPSGEGLLGYLSRDTGHQLVEGVTIGGVAYGGARLVEYMWVAPRASGPRVSEQLIRHTARICGFELTHTAAARMVPIVGAMISGVSTWGFMHMIIEAAIHVAARDALLVRARAYDD